MIGLTSKPSRCALSTGTYCPTASSNTSARTCSTANLIPRRSNLERTEVGHEEFEERDVVCRAEKAVGASLVQEREGSCVGLVWLYRYRSIYRLFLFSLAFSAARSFAQRGPQTGQARVSLRWIDATSYKLEATHSELENFSR
jgi:hypothetical protein